MYLSNMIRSTFRSHMPVSMVLLLCLGIAGLNVAMAGELERRQAKRIHDRIAGVPPTNAVLDQMEADLISGDSSAAAYKAMANPAFYNVTLKNFITPWTNEEQTKFAPLNDYTATVIGLIRDDKDFREVLYGDIIYVGAASLGISGYSNSSNAHYEQLEQLGPQVANLGDPDVLQEASQSSVTGLAANATAGVITTRAAARAFFKDGTNRAMFRFTLLNHLCSDMEEIKDITRTPDRIRQDVSRSPGGDSRIFMNSCIGCHAGMDGMLGGYAYYNYLYDEDTDPDGDSGRLQYTAGQVQPKYLINSNNFKSGYITIDDSWINYWRNGQNALLGWGSYAGMNLDDKGNSYGAGAKLLGREMANSEAFAQCQVKKVFKLVCLRDPDNYAADRNQVNQIVTDFKNSGYKLKTAFAGAADYCKGN